MTAKGDSTPFYDYNAYGNQKNAANDPNPFRYCGEYHDEETGEIYLRARYYSPATGRFGSEDPARSGLNWYGYCNGNPVGFVDPSGLRSLELEDLYSSNKGGKGGNFSGGGSGGGGGARGSSSKDKHGKTDRNSGNSGNGAKSGKNGRNDKITNTTSASAGVGVVPLSVKKAAPLTLSAEIGIGLAELIAAIIAVLSSPAMLWVAIAAIVTTVVVVALDQYNKWQRQKEWEDSREASNQGAIAESVARPASVPADYVIASEMASTLRDRSKGQYYPAMLAGGYVWVSPTPISIGVARGIIRNNDPFLGVMSVSEAHARSVVTLPETSPWDVSRPEIHSGKGEYYSHYHNEKYRKAHSWFFE